MKEKNYNWVVYMCPVDTDTGAIYLGNDEVARFEFGQYLEAQDYCSNHTPYLPVDEVLCVVKEEV